MGREVGSSIQEIEIGSEMAPRERLRYTLKRGSCQGRQQRRPEALASPTGQKVPQKWPPSHLFLASRASRFWGQE